MARSDKLRIALGQLNLLVGDVAGNARRIAVRQPAPPLGRQLNDRERLAVLDALALSTGDIDTRCPLRIVGGAGTRLLIGVRSTEQLKQLKPDYSRLTTLSAQLGAAGVWILAEVLRMTGGDLSPDKVRAAAGIERQ